jgi:tetratricopeptide (TPR) repeat protein
MFIASACSDFLDHPITGAVSDDNIGKIVQENPAKLGEFLANAYRGLGHIDLYGRQLQNSIPVMAHEIDLDYTAEEARNQFARNGVTSANTFLKLYYTKYYSILSSINLTLDLIDHMDIAALSEGSKAMVTNYKGECLFLRAFVHFDLLRLFGEKGPYFGGDYPHNKDARGIILATKLADAETALSARATVEECYNAIVNDLKEAENWIGNSQIPVNNTPAVPGYKDLDYSKNEGWAQKPAVQALLGKVYLYMGDFQNSKTEFEKVIGDNRFKLDKPVDLSDYIQHTDNNAECIFTLQYFDAPGDAYNGAPQHHINRIYGNVPGAWANYFIDQRTAARFGDDPRLYETTLYDSTWDPWSTATTGPVWTALDVNVSDFRYYPRKYIDFFNTASPRDCTKNVDIIRLADVYLMYAEVVLNLGTTNVATEYVNKVRRRAWNETDYNVPGTKGEDLSTVTAEIIQEERYKELFFENIRWFDICRWGILDKELAKYPTTKAGTVQYDHEDYYIPMPESELKSNPLLEQSKGY